MIGVILGNDPRFVVCVVASQWLRTSVCDMKSVKWERGSGSCHGSGDKPQKWLFVNSHCTDISTIVYHMPSQIHNISCLFLH